MKEGEKKKEDRAKEKEEKLKTGYVPNMVTDDVGNHYDDNDVKHPLSSAAKRQEKKRLEDLAQSVLDGKATPEEVGSLWSDDRFYVNTCISVGSVEMANWVIAIRKKYNKRRYEIVNDKETPGGKELEYVGDALSKEANVWLDEHGCKKFMDHSVLRECISVLGDKASKPGYHLVLVEVPICFKTCAYVKSDGRGKQSIAYDLTNITEKITVDDVNKMSYEEMHIELARIVKCMELINVQKK